MSDEDFDESSEDPYGTDGEDDWQPTQESSDSEVEDEDVLTGSSPSPEKSRSKATGKKNAKQRQPVTTSDVKKPTRSGKIMSGSIRELLDKAKAGQRERLNLSKVAPSNEKKKSTAVSAKIKDEDESDDSKSSGDEYLVDPSDLDLGSSFFKTVSPSPAQEKRVPTPNFDCNVGIPTLSDSEDEASDNEPSGTPHNHNVMENLKNFAQNMNEAKANLKKYEAKSLAPEAAPSDVSSLLALGESSAKDAVEKKAPLVLQSQLKNKKKSRRHSVEESGDSDWEEVEDYEEEEEQDDSRAPEDVQVTLDLPDRRRAKLQNELEVALKRQMNKEKREQQVLIHQNGVKDWLEQGNFINRMLNNTTLFQVALKLLPSARAYPKDKADLKYFEELTKWYVGLMKVLPGAEMYPPLAADLDLHNSLRKQIEAKSANSKRDFILIFIILLRAMGIQCRMVINLVVPPIRPPLSELCRISVKPKEEVASTSSSATKKRKAKENGDTSGEMSTSIGKGNGRKMSDLDSSSKSSRGNRSKTENREKSATRLKVDKEKPSTYEEDKTTKSSKTDRAEKSLKREEAKASSSKLKKESDPKAESSAASPRKTRSRAPRSKPLAIPQVDGMDETFSPIGKRTRSRSKTPVEPPMAKKVLLAKNSTDSPIKTKRSSKNIQRSTGNTLQVPKASEDVLFAVDPTEKKTVIAPKKGSKRTANVKVEQDMDEPVEKHPRVKDESTTIDRRVLSTDEEQEAEQKPTTTPVNKIDFWPEVWSEQEEKWLCVDLFKRKVGASETIIRSATCPIAYTLAWNNDSTIKDVSLRYCPQWHSVNKKMRAEQSFLDQVLKVHMGRNTAQDKKEDEALKQLQLDRPMPTSISDFKNHPLYALKRHLLKFEAIYPPDPLTLGFVRGEPVYARECVHVLHSRELWVKQARVVKPGETPYKIVTARPKWERATNTVIKDQPLELFGTWQTMDYEPPVAENGIVPKNAYGNVELFKECMLPVNTVHLPYTGLNKVCKRLKIDYAPAVVGFDFHSGYSHPVYEGYVVCKEFAELVTDAWIKETEEAAQREEEKFKTRVYNNWKRLIKGLFIKKRLERRYNFFDEDAAETVQD